MLEAKGGSSSGLLPFLIFSTRFEKLAQMCKKDLDILQLAQAQGLDPPSHHFQERTFKIVRYGKPKADLAQMKMGRLHMCHSHRAEGTRLGFLLQALCDGLLLFRQGHLQAASHRGLCS